MNTLKMSDEEKKKILDQHKKLEEQRKQEKEKLKQGLQQPEKKETPK